MDRELRRKLLIGLIALILLCCSASAYLSWKAGHRPKAVSTFAAGVTFALLIGSRALRKR
ncbi:MAG: hypothetical protein IPM49_04240 [Flavobacteriales bacterium]|nr:hypothetical protein [Flavobacteriales bacterium]